MRQLFILADELTSSDQIRYLRRWSIAAPKRKPKPAPTAMPIGMLSRATPIATPTPTPITSQKPIALPPLESSFRLLLLKTVPPVTLFGNRIMIP